MTARDDRPHLDGFPVNASTYSNHGCRCAGCRADNTAKCAPRIRRARMRQWVENPGKWIPPKKTRERRPPNLAWFEDIREEWD